MENAFPTIEIACVDVPTTLALDTEGLVVDQDSDEAEDGMAPAEAAALAVAASAASTSVGAGMEDSQEGVVAMFPEQQPLPSAVEDDAAKDLLDHLVKCPYCGYVWDVRLPIYLAYGLIKNTQGFSQCNCDR